MPTFKIPFSMKEISTATSTTRSASSVKNLAILDNECIDAISSTVTCTLRKNAGSWISSDDIQDIVQSAVTHVWLKRDQYDPEKGASFKTWTNTVAHNFAIQTSKRIKKAADKAVAISGLLDLCDCGDDDEPKAATKAFSGIDTSNTWAMDSLGINLGENAADYGFSRDAEDMASENREKALREFLDRRLNENERLLFNMMSDGLSKQEMMEITHKTGGCIDTSISRLRSKVRNWMKASDYYGIE